MSLHHISGHKLTKSNLVSIINRKDKVCEEEPKILQNAVVEEEQPIELKEEHQLREKVQQNLANMRNNIAYLVRPSSQKQLYQKLYSACKSKKKRLRKVNKTEFKIDMGQEGVFKPVKAGQTVDQLQKKILSKNMKSQTDQEKQLFYAVENNLLFDM